MQRFQPPAFTGEIFPFIGGDLQTLRDWFFPPIKTPDTAETIQIDLPDGDRLTASLSKPDGNAFGTLIIVHGLGGSSASQHTRALEAAALLSGYVCMRVNLRGAGTSRPYCKQTYHAKRGVDLIPFIDRMRALYPALPCVMIAHSLGGSVALNMALDYPDEASWLAGLVAISSPLNMIASNARFHKPRNHLYMRYILSAIQKLAATCPELPQSYVNAAKAAKSVEEFDRNVTAPLNGFASHIDYYEAASTHERLYKMQKPLLLLHAENDPWISSKAYSKSQFSDSTIVALTSGGGHIGFHDKARYNTNARPSWHIRTTLEFCNHLRRNA